MQSLPCDCGRNLCKVILSRFPQILQGLSPIEIRCVYHHYGILFIYFNLQGDQHPLLSPLRLPVPPSRLFVEVPDFTAYFTFYVFFIQDNDCETV